jgi:hypothetical protein
MVMVSDSIGLGQVPGFPGTSAPGTIAAGVVTAKVVTKAGDPVEGVEIVVTNPETGELIATGFTKEITGEISIPIKDPIKLVTLTPFGPKVAPPMGAGIGAAAIFILATLLS